MRRVGFRVLLGQAMPDRRQLRAGLRQRGPGTQARPNLKAEVRLHLGRQEPTQQEPVRQESVRREPSRRESGGGLR